MIQYILLLVVGLAMVVKGADWLIDGASSLAKRMQLPELLIGLTVVAFGTSAPELAVNIFAGLANKNEMVLGNVIGSNAFNTLLILGIAGLIYPLRVQKISVRREMPFSLITIVVFYVMANDRLIFGAETDGISRFDAVILLVLFVFFLFYAFGLSGKKLLSSGEVTVFSPAKTWLLVITGIAGLFLGGKLVVDNAVEIARLLRVSEKFIALTIVSMGTSLPELATTAVAAYKKRCDLAVGNILGSNIFNVLLVLGVSAAINPIAYDTALNFDLYVLALATLLLLLAMFTLKSHKVDRKEAAVLLVFYIFYMVRVFLRQ